DVVKVGADALVWGAVLTPKGMIISDCWVRRTGAVLLLLAPADAREAVHNLLRRSFPPRLAKVTDLTEQTAVRWLFGDDPGALADADIARPSGAAPFLAFAPSPNAAALDRELALAGFEPADPALAALAKLLGGWPTLGREIDERTLPQEVRFDELGGVSYDKGC